jgi:PAS domain S-box-containing protein
MLRQLDDLMGKENLYRAIFENAGTAIVVVEKDTTISLANREVENLTGHPLDEVIGKRSWKDFVARMEDLERMLEYRRQRYKDPQSAPKRYEVVLQDKFCQEKNVLVTADLIPSTNKIVISFNDITEQRNTEKNLDLAFKQWERTFDSIQDGIFLLNSNGVIKNCNQRMTNYINKNKNEIIEKKCFEVMHQLKDHIDVCPFRKMMRTRKTENIIKYIHGKWFDIRVDPLFDEKRELLGAVHIMRDITEQKVAKDNLNTAFDQLRRMYDSTISILQNTLEIRDPYTSGHAERVANLVCAIANRLGLDQDRIKGLRMASLVHDTGKIAVPAEILTKPTRLSEMEYAIIKEHPTTAYKLMKDIDLPWPIAETVYQHHERINGSGYPQGITGDEMLLEAKILAVADVAEAIASHRPYRPGLGITTSMQELKKNKGISFDSEVVEACLHILEEQGQLVFNQRIED